MRYTSHMFFKRRIYLDAAAGTAGNPSSVHAEGRAAKTRLENARVEIARLVECKPDDVIFTSGATEANALAILGLAKAGEHVLYLPSAHASIVENAKMLAARGVRVEPLPIKDGAVDCAALAAMLRPETVLVTMGAVCGETGTIWNTREVATTLQRYAAANLLLPEIGEPATRCGIGLAARALRGEGSLISRPRLHVDASQAPWSEKLSRSHFGADLLTLDGGKLGAGGAGCLIAHRTIPLAPLYGGGGQERGLRSGTENVEAIGKFAAALAAAATGRDAFKARAAELRAQLLAAISAIPGLFVNEGRQVAPHILNISLIGRDTDYVVALLDTAGFAVSTKSACESRSGEGSRAVLALSGDAARAAATLRISFGSATTTADIARFAAALTAAVQFVDSTASR